MLPDPALINDLKVQGHYSEAPPPHVVPSGWPWPLPASCSLGGPTAMLTDSWGKALLSQSTKGSLRGNWGQRVSLPGRCLPMAPPTLVLPSL